MKKICFTTMLLLILSSCCSKNYDKTAQKITEFYKQYISIMLTDTDRTHKKKLVDEYITKGALNMIYGFTASTGVNSIIRAQDVNRFMLTTVNTVHTKDDWYLVSWSWNKEDEAVNIPLKAIIVDGKLQITYMPHPLTTEQCSDDLLHLPTRTKNSDINQSSSMDFISSFYDVYLSNYCLMDLDLTAKIKDLRDKYLSENAKAQFKKAEDEYLFDNMHGFDLLINDFYFDPMWYKSLNIKHVGEDNYKMSFKTPSGEVIFDIAVLKSNNGYIIDSIILLSGE